MNSIAHVKILSENELAREGIKRIISEEGIESSCASSVDNDLVDQENYIFLVETDQEREGLETCFRVRAQVSLSKIVLMCPDFTIQSVREGFEGGINGFLTRKMGYSALIWKLALVVANEKILPVKHFEAMLSASPVPAAQPIENTAALANLSEREVGILQCLVDGDANKMISRRLNIAEPTVKVHVKSILRKLQLSNRTQAAIWAINQRIGASAQEVRPTGPVGGRRAGPLHAVT
ncbi:MAG TPA: response regulator transcription factor [Oscillatoriaceae cyanobacterium]|jgi:two-component system nitrate/nitrite response regulator NarL